MSARRLLPSVPLAVRIVAPVVVAALGLGALASHAATPAQAGVPLFMPDLQARGQSAAAFGIRPLGQQGIGATDLELQNRGPEANAVSIALFPKAGDGTVTLDRGLGAERSARVSLSSEPSVAAGSYGGRIGGERALAGIARTRWLSGAATAFEAVPAAREMILPLFARSVYSYTSVIYAQNTDPVGAQVIELTIFDNEDGSILKESASNTAPGGVASWDTAVGDLTFGADVIGSNSATGGYLGHLWLSAGKPIAVMAYGDETAAQGSVAYVGRPASDAHALQYLPLVRAGYRGDSLIAVANAGSRAVDVTIDYRGAAFSPSGAGESFSQSFKIGPRGSAFVDLSTRARGTRPSPDLPRGNGPDQGFIGSATVRASAPVLAVVQDEQLRNGVVDAEAAYNAFSPADLGSAFAAPVVRKVDYYLSSSLFILNTGTGPVAATADFFTDADVAAGSATVDIAGGGLAQIKLIDVAAFPDGLGRAVVHGDGALAVLIYDERDLTGTPIDEPIFVHLRSLGDGRGGSGTTTLTPKGADVEVKIEATFGAGGFPGAEYTATIREAACGDNGAQRFKLANVKENKSTTLLRGTTLKEIATGKLSIVITSMSFMGRPPRDIMCGRIDELRPGENVDTMLAAAVRLAGAITNPPTNTPVATVAPTGTASPGASATPTLAPPTATTDGRPVYRLYLPTAMTGR